jgi:hypothetical protein
MNGPPPVAQGPAPSPLPEIPRPVWRPLKIYPTDPTQGYASALKTSINVEYERLTPGPVGERLEVVDYDGYSKCFYEAVNLDQDEILIQGGLEPSESDPRFHQQMVYAVASRTLANFDRALGRRVSLRKGSKNTRLRLFPHAFNGRNAFYDHDLHGVLFGYFQADMDDPGPNMPGQTVYTCLSHDIIAHEMTHAVVDRLRRYFLEPSNVDVLAFHEGFSDLVALFQHFSFRDLLSQEIRRSRSDLRKPTLLVQLARQFGFATGEGKSLRSAIDKPDAKLLSSVIEPHDRGAILVAAVFDGFFETYSNRIRDLIQIATGGSGELPRGELQPALANRVAAEAAATAQRQLDMCIRAFDYLPPVDVTFGDYLRALVTADFEINPADELDQRAALIEGFRRRGIYPVGVTSLAEQSLRWPAAENIPNLKDQLGDLLPKLLKIEADRFTQRSTDPRVEGLSKEHFDSIEEIDEPGHRKTVYAELRAALLRYAKNNAAALYLRSDLPIFVSGFNAVFRTATNGRLLIELVAQFVQTDPEGQVDALLGGVAVKGGTTIIVSVDGTVRYAITKPLPGPHLPGTMGQEAQQRVQTQSQFVAELDARDPFVPYMSKKQFDNRMKARMALRSLHSGLWP